MSLQSGDYSYDVTNVNGDFKQFVTA